MMSSNTVTPRMHDLRKVAGAISLLLCSVSSALAAPTLTLTATPTTITAGAVTKVNWTSSGATQCVASGAWSGSKARSGNASVKLYNSGVLYMTCKGGGTQVQKSVSITVAAPAPTPVPTVALQATPADIAVNGTAQLSWSSSNATACTASGGWSGSTAVSGSTQVGPLATSQTYTLACTGPGGSAQTSTMVTVSGPAVSGGLLGAVDSSMIDARGSNQVYVFAGNVSPRDTQGTSGDAVFKLPVTQDHNACTFGYSLPSLPTGTYTLAFTAQAQNDRAALADTLQFTGTAVIAVDTSAVRRDFRPAGILQVGPTRQYRTIAQAAAVAQTGAVIEVDAGDYPDDIVVWRDDNLVVRGVGGRPVVHATQVIGYVSGDDRRNGKGLWVVNAARMRIENFDLSGARVSDENGAGIRNEGRDLTVCNSYVHDNENGFLGGAYGRLTIEYSTFANNGGGDGYTHNVYVDEGAASGDQLVFRHNSSHHARIGHTLKTRARENFILYNRLMDESDGTSSYAIDVPDGGLTYVIGNLIQQGPNTDNSDIVEYAAESLAGGRVHELYMVNNTLVNDRSAGTFVRVNSGASVFRTINNLFIGSGTLYGGKQPQATTNLQAPASTLLDAAGFDYRLRSDASAVNAGSVPGAAGGFDLSPVFQYVHTAKRTARTAAGALDVGAYEGAP